MLNIREVGIIEDAPRAGFTTKFAYDVVDRSDKVNDDEFERIREAIEKWARSNRVGFELQKTRKGFEVSLSHSIPDGDGYGMSLFLHLSKGVFRQFEREKRRLSPRQ
jgi:hypothetical protein